jgi:dephospho-CoA kinase
MSSDKMIFIVNGKPRAGKDTFAQILNEYMDVYKYSSVTKVKEIAKQCGWTGAKEERDRKFLHELKMLTSAYSDMSYNDVIEEIDKFKKGELDADIFVVDVREPEDIDRLVKATKAFTIFIENNRVPSITSNAADANVENYKYDFVIQNNGTLEDFEGNIKLFIEVLMTFMFMYEDRF